jgi:serine/threonine protein kinase
MRKLCPNCRKDVDLKNDRMSNAKICSICGTVVIHSSTQLQAGSIVGGFQIESELGRGGMGIVYRAKQLNLERQVALKVLADDLAKDDTFVDSFFREARAAAGLSHPNIVQVYDAGSTPEGIYYFAMELVVGETLDTRIMREGALNPRDALDIASKIAGALNYAWQTQQLCHGDIKPDNIILNSSGGTKLADLGLAKFMHEENNPAGGSHELMGTPLYAPPEVINGQVDRIDCRSDMYSFGATLFHMLAGIPPFPGNNPEEVLSRHLHEAPPSLLEFNHELNPQIDELVQALLAKKIEDRPSTWADVEKMMQRIHDVERKIFHRSPSPSHRAAGGAAQESPPGEQDPAGTLIKMLVVVAVILGAAVLGFHMIRSRSNAPSLPTTGPEAAPVPAPDPILAEWDAIQPNLPANRNDACSILEAFIAKHGEATPPPARQLLDKYRGELNQLSMEREERARQKAEFESRIAAIRGQLAVVPMTMATAPDPLRKLASEIEAVLEQANRNPNLSLTPEEADSLSQSYMKLSTLLLELEKVENARLLEEQERLAQERRARDVQARQELEQKRQTLLAANACVDAYYLLIANYLDKRNLAAIVKDFAAWHDQHETIPGEILGRRDFLVATVVPAEERFLAMLTRHQAAFSGQLLPGDVAPPQYRQYRVESFTDGGIRLFLEEEKVRLGGSLPWSRVPVEPFVLWANARLAESGAALPIEDRRAILSHLLLNNLGTALQKTLQGYPDYPKNERDLWISIAADFEQAAREQGLIGRWQAVRAALASSDNDAAASLFGELRIKAAGSFFADRHRPELDLLCERLGYFNPLIPLQELMDEFDAAQRNGNVSEALALAMCAKSRYAATPKLGDDLRGRLAGATEQALAATRKASQVKDVNASRLPFFYWEKEVPGDAWVYAGIIRKSKLLDKSPALLANLESAALLDAGDWGEAAAASRQGLPANKLAAMEGRMQAWAPALIYAQATLAHRYEGSREQGRWIAALATSVADLAKMPMKALGTCATPRCGFATSPKNTPSPRSSPSWRSASPTFISWPSCSSPVSTSMHTASSANATLPTLRASNPSGKTSRQSAPA